MSLLFSNAGKEKFNDLKGDVEQFAKDKVDEFA
jgi:hypothetical protein